MLDEAAQVRATGERDVPFGSLRQFPDMLEPNCVNDMAHEVLRDTLRSVRTKPDVLGELHKILVDHFDLTAHDFFAYAEALTLSLAHYDLSLAGTLTQARFPGSKYVFTFADDRLTHAEHHFRWRAAPGAHQVTLNHSFLLHERGLQPIIGNRIASVLPLIDAYDAAVSGAGSAIVDLGDWSAGVGMCFCDNRFGSLLIPDCSFLASDGYETAREFFAVAPAWEQREPRAIWRGSSTGNSKGDLLALPRVELCRIAREREDIIDAGITDIVQAKSPEEAAALRNSGLCKGFVGMPDHGSYKFQIDIDGNTNSWPGLFQKLLSGSPVLKVASPDSQQQWYYGRLRPWTNFVPIRSDMTDLAGIIDFLCVNDDIARRIGHAGQELAMSMTMAKEIASAQATIRAAFDRDRFQQTSVAS